MFIIKLAIFFSVLIVLLPITLVVWIPLLIRMISVIAFSALASVFTKANMGNVQTGLEEAIRLPISVIYKAYEAVFGVDHEKNRSSQFDERGMKHFFSEALFAIIFWLSTIAIAFYTSNHLLAFTSNASSSDHDSNATPSKAVVLSKIYKYVFASSASVNIGVRRKELLIGEESATFIVSPAQLIYDPNKNTSSLKVTFCLTTEPAYSFWKFYAWYTDPKKQSSVRWTYGTSTENPIRLRPQECGSITLESLKESKSSLPIILESPLGELHLSFNDENSFGSLNLEMLKNEGQLRLETLAPDEF